MDNEKVFEMSVGKVYPLTACEICKQEGCEKADPRGFRKEKDK